MPSGGERAKAGTTPAGRRLTGAQLCDALRGLARLGRLSLGARGDAGAVAAVAPVLGRAGRFWTVEEARGPRDGPRWWIATVVMRRMRRLPGSLGPEGRMRPERSRVAL